MSTEWVRNCVELERPVFLCALATARMSAGVNWSNRLCPIEGTIHFDTADLVAV